MVKVEFVVCKKIKDMEMNQEWIEIDGSAGEGGGQIIRTSLSLSMITGKPFSIKNIRAGRKKPGLMRQHLTCVKAAEEICGAEVSGAEVGSQQLVFKPGKIESGCYDFKIGTAGSTGLVLQTVMPALLMADATSTVILEGGTHNSMSPPFDFLKDVFLETIKPMGCDAEAELIRYGFYPAGGGKVRWVISPWTERSPLKLLRRGEVVERQAHGVGAQIPYRIPKNEANSVVANLGWGSSETRIELVESNGPGNILMVKVFCKKSRAIFSSFGRCGVSALKVSELVVKEARRYLDSEAPVDEHLADQVLVYCALAGGVFRCNVLSEHTLSNIEVIKKFLDVRVDVKTVQENLHEIVVNVDKFRR